MRVFFSRFTRTPGRRRRAKGSVYRSLVACARLQPEQVRNQRFGVTPLGRRGLDPDEVQDFLNRVAADLAAAYQAVERSRAESNRVRDALRNWQSQQAQDRDVYADHR